MIPTSPHNENSVLDKDCEMPCKETEPKEEKVPVQSPFQYEEKNNRMYFRDFKLLEKVRTVFN